MSENIKMEDLKETPVDSTSESTEPEEVVESTTEQDPLKTELERVHKKTTRSEIEKAAFSLKKTAERLKELGGDPTEILGIEKDVETDDDKPVTVGMLKAMQSQNATKTAMELADDIQDETEKELTKYHLANSIKSTGNPTEDLSLARAIVNSVKNKQVIEEIKRKVPAKTHSSASGVPAKHTEVQELTPEELAFTRPPFNLTKEQILKIRK